MSLKEVPLDLNAGMVSRFKTKDPLTRMPLDDGPIDRLIGAATTMQQIAGRAREYAEAIKKDTTMTGHAARGRYRSDVSKLIATAEKKLDDALKAALAEHGRLSRAMISEAPVNALATEIRSRLATMKPEQRDAVLDEADDKIMGAVLTAPGFLSGLTKSQLEIARMGYQAKRFPEEVARASRVWSAMEATQRVSASFKSYCEDLIAAVETPASAQASARTKAAQDKVAAAAE